MKQILKVELSGILAEIDCGIHVDVPRILYFGFTLKRLIRYMNIIMIDQYCVRGIASGVTNMVREGKMKSATSICVCSAVLRLLLHGLLKSSNRPLLISC